MASTRRNLGNLPIRPTKPVRELENQRGTNTLPAHQLVEHLSAFAIKPGEDAIHCDVKPNNLILNDSGHVTTIDLGLAHLDKETGESKAEARHVRISPQKARLVVDPIRGSNPVKPNSVPGYLWEHALETFGSASVATDWFLAECGALKNRAPLDALIGEHGAEEVDRILGCLDYGMIA